jgi:hypothetical protein
MTFATIKPRQTRERSRIAAGLRAFFNIADRWGLSNDEAMALLGQPGRTTFYSWKRGDVGQVAHGLDLASRLSYVLGIFKTLETLYQRPELADRWVRQPNDAFGGQSALERMLAGQMADLAVVRDHLDGVGAGG